MAESKPDICTIDGCGRPYRCRGWCATHWLRWRKYGDVDAGRPVRPMKDPDASFWSHVDKRDPDECWQWTGAIDPNGYGRYYTKSGSLAHRWSYTRFVGEIGDEQHLDHVCHTNDKSCPRGRRCLHRRCVNPAHLEPVTIVENSYRAYGSTAETCPAGHPRTPENTKKSGRNTVCKVCAKDRSREWARANRRAA